MVLPVLPVLALGSVVRTPRVAASVTTSPFTGTQQVQSWGGEWWEYQLDFFAQTGDDGRALSAFFTGLGGPAGQFIFRDPGEENTASLGTPVVSGGAQTGYALETTGWTPSITVLKAGQFISLGSDTTLRLHQITTDAVADGSGDATLAIWPKLRESPADGASIETANPGVRLRLASDIPVLMEPHRSYRFSISAREKL